LFGTKQGVEKVKAEGDSHRQPDDRFTHGAPRSKLSQRHRVETHQRDDGKSERHKSEIEHDRLLAASF
jgi:hypothetical protein